MFRKGQSEGSKISLHLLMISPILVCLFRSICRINKKLNSLSFLSCQFWYFVCLFVYAFTLSIGKYILFYFSIRTVKHQPRVEHNLHSSAISEGNVHHIIKHIFVGVEGMWSAYHMDKAEGSFLVSQSNQNKRNKEKEAKSKLLHHSLLFYFHVQFYQ